jgi:hypothetical protein
VADFRSFEAYAERERYQPEEEIDTSFSDDNRKGPQP